ncbi:hypothetical protein [Neisseria sp. S1]|uniref:hypothetical protein n=1 Tax=Neisseria sp. S1 TaxID=3318354 RepID=UPI003A88B2C1
MNYQELISRTLAVKHASLEIGLAKAREQQPFVEQVSRKLDATSWDYTVRMSTDFSVTFNLEIGQVSFKHQYQAVKQALSERFNVDLEVINTQPVLIVTCRRSHYSCRVIFGDVPK